MYDELVKRLREEAQFPDTYPEDRDLHTKAADAIEALSASTDMAFVEEDGRMVIKFLPHWIPVTERLPEKNGSYLVYVYGEVTEMNCWHGKWHRLGDDYTKAVTHWMPLPPKPKEDT